MELFDLVKRYKKIKEDKNLLSKKTISKVGCQNKEVLL